MEDIRSQVKKIALIAKEASVSLAMASTEQKNEALFAMAAALRRCSETIEKANAQDMRSAADAGTSEAILDRLMLDDSRICAMADALEELVELADPIGVTLAEDTMYNGVSLERVSVPLGVVAVVYEARPNVTADAAGICLKSGNACVLRGGSMALHSNAAIVDVLKSALAATSISPDCIQFVSSKDRAATDALMQLHGIVDVLIPRGGAGLIAHCVETSKVPVIETGTGNCHVYVHESAEASMAKDIVMNSKCRRYGVCNACETLLIDNGVADDLAAEMMALLANEGVLIHADERALKLASERGVVPEKLVLATDEDWATEYLGPEISVHYVSGVDEAIEHINRFGTKHSESIVAADEKAAEAFLKGVDAAAVYHNVATSFTDGGQFGLGAEIGISTQKLHARGPFALDALTSYKYVLRGNGQIRD